MGRSNFNSAVARAYTIYPVPQVTANPADGSDYTNTLSAGNFIVADSQSELISGRVGGTVPEFDPSGSTRSLAMLRAGAALKQGFMWSLVAAGGATGTQTLAVRNNTTSEMTSPVSITGATAMPSGVVEGSWRVSGAGGAVALAVDNRAAAQGPLQSSLFIDSTDVSQTINRPALAIIYTAKEFTDAGVVTPLPVDRFTTDFPGAVKGFYITVPIGDADLASGQTGQPIRRITMPIAVKLHEVCFSTGASAAGNSVLLFNVTQNVAITGSTAMVSATPGAAVVAATNLTNRSIAKGDVIELRGTTGGTGITAAAAILTGHTTGHFNAIPLRDTMNINATTLEPEAIFRQGTPTSVGRQSFSGPCRGGFAWLQFPVGTAAISQTGLPISRIIAPFDCSMVTGTTAYRASAAGNSYTVFNVTKALTVFNLSGVNTLTVSATHLTSQISNPTISKGDVLELRVTTGGTAGYAQIGSSILVHVRGHVNTSPALD
jgi:hypothetical protein